MTRYELIPVVEGYFGLDGGAMFGIIPRPLWQKTNPPDDKNRIRLATRCWVLKSDERTVLVDTGVGDKWSDKEAGRFAIEHPHRNLHGALRAAGIEPQEITDVILTHLHFDHAGGATLRNPSGDVVPAFPKARHHIQAENLGWAESPSIRDIGSYRVENFDFLINERVEVVEHDGEVEVLPGIDVRLSFGHTPGLQLPTVEIAGTRVLFMADLMPTRGHVNLAYGMGYDLLPLDTVEEKLEVLEGAVAQDWVLGLEHDPDVGFIRIEKLGERYRAVPVPTPTWD